MKGKTDFANAYLVAGLSVGASVVGAVFVLGFSLAHRLGEDLDAARRGLRDQAALVAESFDSSLRTADIILEYAAAGLPGDWAAVRGKLAAAASFLTSGEGLYAYDGDGRPVAGFPPAAESPPLDPGLASRLRSGARAETVISRTEGGARILVARSLDAPARPFAGALVASFGPSALNESVLGLMGTGVAGIDVLDAREEIAFSRPIGSATEAALTDAASRLTASVALKTHPLSVALHLPRETVVAQWREDAVRTGVMTALVLVLVLALGVYALALAKKSEKNRELLKSLEYRSTLFKELNHRVKNNLAMVSGFLSLAEGEAEERGASAVAILRETSERVRAMAEIHDLIGVAGSSGTVDFGDFLSRLASDLAIGYGAAGPDKMRRIDVETRAEGRSELGLDRAVPCALLVNELVTNCFKYAFPGGREGRIEIVFRSGEDGAFELEISDDGVGLPADAPASRPGRVSLGLLIVKSLAAQLGAKLERRPAMEPAADRGPGLRWLLRAPARSSAPRQSSGRG